MTDPLAIPRPEYPRPQFVRAAWLNLNGPWSYTFDCGKSGLERGFAASTGFDGQITVPFCPESALSGVGHTDFIEAMWYQRPLEVPAAWAGQRILLVARDGVGVHTLEEIVVLVVLAHMLQAVPPVILFPATALRRAVRRFVAAPRPFADMLGRTRTPVLAGLHANFVKQG